MSATVRPAVAADAAGIASLFAELGYALSPADIAGRMAGPAGGAHDFYRSQGYDQVSEHFLKHLRERGA